MSIAQSVLAFLLHILFPVTNLYKPLRSDETDGVQEMPAERNRSTEWYGASSASTLPQTRRRPARRGDNGYATAQNRTSWYQAGFTKLSDLASTVVRGGRLREERKVQKQVTRRQKPASTLDTLDEDPRVTAVHHDEQSRRLFQDTLDLCSEADAISACRALNEKISDTILTLVDEWTQSPSLSQRRTRSSNVSGLDSRSAEDLRQIIGQGLFHLIKRARSKPPSDQLQNWVTDALHAAAVYHVSFIVSNTFCPVFPSDTNRRMESTFRNMLGAEPIATPLRWRALTYTYAVPDRERQDVVRRVTAEHENSLAYCIRSIFILAGESSSSTFHSQIENAVKESEIVKSALDLSEMLKTKFFSVCLDVLIIRPDQEFREEAMDTDGNTPPESLRGHPVLCTLEIGLCDVHPQARPRRFLLKPKVALMPSR